MTGKNAVGRSLRGNCGFPHYINSTLFTQNGAQQTIYH